MIIQYLLVSKSLSLLKPKPIKTSCNQPKPVETTQNFKGFENLGFFTSFCFANFGIFSQKVLTVVLISNLTFVFKSFEPKSPNLSNEIFSVRYFKGDDFKPDIRFLWLLAAYYPVYTNQFNVSVLQLIWKTFFLFFSQKSQNIMASIVYFCRCLLQI